MLTVSQAIELIRQTSQPLDFEPVELGDAIGRVLAEPVRADIDAPPFDKAMMDGYAVKAAEVGGVTKDWKLLDRVAAGQTPTQTLVPGSAIPIMTGAQIPPAADAVVRWEDTAEDRQAGTIQIRCGVRPGLNVIARGSIFRAGQTLLPAGHRLAARDLGLLAECGGYRPVVFRRPKISVVATGNEICPPNLFPSESQIRNSNGPLLLGLAAERGTFPQDLGIAGDDPLSLSRAIQRGLEGDVLILTGGVSTGAFDLVPRMLQEAGVRQVFHKVALKPGKPVWFGVFEQSDRRCLVFGLPGNPVSTFVCFELFVGEALRVMWGMDAAPHSSARLKTSIQIRGDRPTYWPARLSIEDGVAWVETLDWQGSADQRCLVEANGLAVFPDGNREYAAESQIGVLLLR